MEKAKKTISTINVELGEMPATTNRIIKIFSILKTDMRWIIWEKKKSYK